MSGLNRVLKIYTELDALFDYRRGLVQHLLTSHKSYPSDAVRKADGDKQWELYLEGRYRKRRLDNFDIPELKLSTADYQALYKERRLEHFLMYYPSVLEKHMFKMVMDMEMLDTMTPSIKGATLYVNTFPYQLDTELNALLLDTVNRRFGGRYDVQLVHADPRSFTAHTFGQYDYVFKYDILLGDYEWFVKSLLETQIPATTFFVPSLFLAENDMIVGGPEDMIYALAATLSPAIKLVPCNAVIYDYA
ncbi:hypothetical protein JOAD_224 [Erwinia phage vB_EamM_Joad]|uniref:Uncharacterized protein n=1 Tax=Erwinia phage vB_EamM_Joad TaxID=2026081 RepID=A0A223LI43_9CAUD|nr:hypothetical protein JOAD_224 [Erwinia phage vB_EamM_Joad]